VSGLINTTKITVAPNGKFIYITEDGDVSAKSSIVQFSVGKDGQLTPLDPFIVDTGRGPYGIAITPDSQFAYISSLYDYDISQYRVKISQ
jgi:6-phosphogluconolactonase (cycloisomerase 2 family)